MVVKQYSKNTNGFFTRALRFIKNNEVKMVLSYSKSKGKKRWCDDNLNQVRFGYFKKKELIFTARALIIGKHKFTLLTNNQVKNA